MSQVIKKAYYNFLCDKYFFQLKGVSFFSKLAYIKEKYLGIIKKRKEIKFIGRRYHYDNIFGSVVFQLFPLEIEKIAKKLDFGSVGSLLDIGANTGQWSFALKSYFPDISVYSFEPIPMAFECLQKNSEQFGDWKVYNFAIGNAEGKKELYYSLDGTTTGSFYRNKVEHNFKRKNIQSRDVDVIKIKEGNKLKIPLDFDLVKVDVEGFEKEVLESLHAVNFKYIYVEIHKSEKTFDFDIEETLSILKAQGRRCDVIYKNIPAIAPDVIEVLVKCS